MDRKVDQKVSADEVLRSAGAEKPVTGGTFLQRTGLVLAVAVGSIGAFVIVALIGRWIFYAPAPPVLPTGADANTIRTTLENYRSLQQIALEPFTTLFDSIVVKVILPVFTSILGYIFGTRAGERER
jgi:hypothetical protein